MRLAGKTSATLKFTAIKTTDAGSYTCVVKNSAGSVTTKAAVVTVKATPGSPASLAGHASSKTSITLSWKAPTSTAATAPTSYKLERATDTLFSKGKKTITLGAVTSYVDTTLTANTTYYYRVSAATIAGTSKASAVLKVATLKATATGTARMTELMARVYCGTGSSIATGGFVIGAGAPKSVLIRAVGPTLSTLGVASTALLKDPMIELRDAGGGLIGSNNNWKDNGNASAIASAITKVKATPFAKTDTASAALLVTLPPGAYTFSVNGAASGKGIVLIEVYDTQ